MNVGAVLRAEEKDDFYLNQFLEKVFKAANFFVSGQYIGKNKALIEYLGRVVFYITSTSKQATLGQEYCYLAEESSQGERYSFIYRLLFASFRYFDIELIPQRKIIHKFIPLIKIIQAYYKSLFLLTGAYLSISHGLFDIKIVKYSKNRIIHFK